jgi:hypothetical protein
LGLPTDWNRTAVQRLIIEVEDTLAMLGDALMRAGPVEQARAIRNGRRAYKEFVRRSADYRLTPEAAIGLERLLAAIQAKVRELREKLAANPLG